MSLPIDVDDIGDDEIANLLRSNTKERIISLFSKASETGGGNFACGGKIDSSQYGMPAIQIVSNDLPNNSSSTTANNLIKLPITTREQALGLIKHCTRAPYGKGEETIYDDNVRNSWQLSPTQFKITNKHWKQYMDALIENHVKPGLGIHPSVIVRYNLYKLLLYEEGGHFDYHRDTEKEDKMFATLVVQLPSLYSGGEVIVQHANNEEKYDFAKEASSAPFFFSFYCDCEHKVAKLTSGYRTCLVYNVCYISGVKPNIVDKSIHLDNLNSIVENWDVEKPYFYYLLEHKYSEEGLKYDCLKGRDSNLMQLLLQYKSKYGTIDTKLALMKKTQYGNGYHWDNGSYHTIYYQIDESGSVSDQFDIDKEEIIPENILKNLKVSGSEFEEHTGNEGTHASRWYHSACVLIFPTRFKCFLSFKQKGNPLEELEILWQMYQKDESQKVVISTFIKKFIENKDNLDNVANYIASLNDITLAHQLLNKRKSELSCGDIYGVLILVQKFGIEPFRQVLLDLIPFYDTKSVAIFLKHVVDKEIAEKVISFQIDRRRSDYETLLLMCKDYGYTITEDQKKELLRSSRLTKKEIYEMGHKLKDPFCFLEVLDRYFKPLSRETRRNVNQIQEIDIDSDIISNSINYIGLGAHKKLIKELVADYCEKTHISILVEAIKIFSLCTCNYHTVSYLINKLGIGLKKRDGKDGDHFIASFVTIFKELHSKGSEFEKCLSTLATSVKPSKECWIKYETVMYPIITKLQGDPVISTQPIQKLIRRVISYYDYLVICPSMFPLDDWSINISLKCPCEHCQKITSFLQSPNRIYQVSLSQSFRNHIKSCAISVCDDLKYDTSHSGVLTLTKVLRSEMMLEKAVAQIRSKKTFLTSLLTSVPEPPTKKSKK